MNRRQFLKLGTVAAAMGSARVGAEPVSKVETKDDWIEREIAATLARYRAWKGADETVTFAFVTDIHARVVAVTNPPNYADSKMHIPLMLKTALAAEADFVADLGDQDFDWASTSPEQLQARMDATVQLYRDFPKPVLFCVGNHDHGRPFPGTKERPVSNARFGEAFNTLAAKHGHSLELSACKSWGYYDVPNKRARVFFLNSSDGAYYGFTDAQLQFVADSLASMPNGWTALAFEHYCIVGAIGHWRSFREKQAFVGKNADILVQIVEGFYNKAKGKVGNVTWDFTKRADALFGGFFFGDSHFDHQIDWQNIHYTISQGFGGCPDKDVAYGAVKLPFSRTKQTLFELGALKPAKGEVRLFRVGVGGAARDRGYFQMGFNMTKW